LPLDIVVPIGKIISCETRNTVTAEVEIPDAEELEELRAKKFTRRVALVTAIFAVILAITSWERIMR
jgi:hypothetical protein